MQQSRSASPVGLLFNWALQAANPNLFVQMDRICYSCSPKLNIIKRTNRSWVKEIRDQKKVKLLPERTV